MGKLGSKRALIFRRNVEFLQKGKGILLQTPITFPHRREILA
jgi:hypothetical protein